MASQAGIVAVGVPIITLSPLALACSITLSKKEKSYCPSFFSIRCHENSAIRITLLPNSLIVSKSASNKDARIQHKQASLYIELLQQNGTRLNDNITKHLEDGIWELRPGNNRVFYFFYENNTFVLLHQFRKKSQKTPKREIEKAKSERIDYLSRKEHDKS